ncbi:MAG TPA: Yip1 family protein [Myxococcota bacterium]|nr:Yip1 family protein [Myxococcota bacterium]HRY95607.1 Yip1 family protein [Myxococcota bacterium]HSA20137.1 Yip1 family protein [Myxococcota bacterium]
MPLELPVLVRCAGCAHNFESRLTGRIRCPVCRAEVWLEPPAGLAPDRAEDAPPPAPPVPAAPVHPADGPDPDREGSPEEPASERPPGEPPAAPDPEAAEEDAPAPDPQALFARKLAEAGVRLREPEVVVPAWEARAGGPAHRFYDTFRQILTNPPRFFYGLKVDRLDRSWTFAWLLCSLAALFASLYGLWNLDRNEAALLDALRAEPGVKPEEVVSTLRGLLTFGAWGAPLLGLANAWVTAGLYHLGVMAVGKLFGLEHRGFRATFRATAYGFAPLLLVVVPVVGQLIGSLWSIVLQVLAIAFVHRLGPGRAALAVLLPLAGLLGLLLMLW